MALVFTGSGGLFNKVGAALGIILDTNYFRGIATPAAVSAPDTTPQLKTKLDAFVAMFAAGVTEKSIVDGLYTSFGSWQTSSGGFNTVLQKLVQNVVIDMVAVDYAANQLSPPFDGTLTTALKCVITQMGGYQGGTQSHVTASTPAIGTQANVGATIATFATVTASGPVLISSTKDGSGLGLDYMMPEVITATCTADSFTGKKTKWQEQVTIQGVPAVADPLSYLWPAGGGSGMSPKVFTVADPNLSAQAGGNILQASEFTTATTTNYPDNWVILVGVPTTNIVQATDSFRADLTKCLEFLGDGSTLPSICQPFNTPTSLAAGGGGTPFNLAALPMTEWAVSYWWKVSAQPASGVGLTVDLVNGSNSTVNDAQSVANSAAINLHTLGTDTNWHLATAVFRLPANPPSTLKLRFTNTTTAIDNTITVKISHVSMVQMTQLYPGGAFVAAVGGNTAPYVNDSWTLAATNTWGANQQGWNRLFNLAGLGLRLPTTGGTALSEGLVA